MSLVKNLFYDVENFNLNIPEWHLPDSGIVALLGPSGAGKTTIFKILLGLIPCPTLEWIFNGEDLAKLSVQKRKLGVVFQSLELFPHLTARQNILFAAKARQIPQNIINSNLELFSIDLDMKKFLDRKVEFLSGGEKQRTAMARALMGEPIFLFLDEPFSSLDEELKSDARMLVKKILAKKKTPTLLITHDPRDIEQMADHVFHLKGGHLTT